MMAAREDAAVDLGVQRLDAAVHHLGKAGDVRDVDDRQAGIGEGLGRAAGRDQLESARGERRGQMEPGRSYQKHSEWHAASMIALMETKQRRKPNVMDHVFGIDTKCNGPVSSRAVQFLRTRKAASAAFFCCPQLIHEVGRG